ncbi:hypothetical protein PM082_000300 [Marasmius tenuissimus]|nr:hypothetical protein PM082_000300 [Marasmius tenuissimus]
MFTNTKLPVFPWDHFYLISSSPPLYWEPINIRVPLVPQISTEPICPLQLQEQPNRQPSCLNLL